MSIMGVRSSKTISKEDLKDKTCAPEAKPRKYTALFDYEATQQSEVSFKKGDKLEVFKTLGKDWFIGKNVKTKVEGFIPIDYVGETDTFEVMRYYYPGVDKVYASNLLMGNNDPVGTFLLRRSEEEKDVLVVEIKDNDRPRRYRILKSSRGYYIPMSQPYFPNVVALVKYYQGHQDGLALKLGQACTAKMAPPTIQVPTPASNMCLLKDPMKYPLGARVQSRY